MNPVLTDILFFLLPVLLVVALCLLLHSIICLLRDGRHKRHRLKRQARQLNRHLHKMMR